MPCRGENKIFCRCLLFPFCNSGNFPLTLVLFNISFRYFSAQGWSGGPYPITVPQTLRSALQDTSDPQTGGTGAARTSNWDNNSKKELRSVFDLVGHLCGRPVPGIPLAASLPACPVDRVRQIHWMYCTLLTFLRYGRRRYFRITHLI